jgi:hypothetical protein
MIQETSNELVQFHSKSIEQFQVICVNCVYNNKLDKKEMKPVLQKFLVEENVTIQNPNTSNQTNQHQMSKKHKTND